MRIAMAPESGRGLRRWSRLGLRQQGVEAVEFRNDLEEPLEPASTEDLLHRGTKPADPDRSPRGPHRLRERHQRTKRQAREELEIPYIDDDLRRLAGHRLHHRSIELGLSLDSGGSFEADHGSVNVDVDMAGKRRLAHGEGR
jgi:hypothetical protein